MLILAIDTSDEVGVIALGKDSSLVCEYHFHSRMTLLKRLVPNIDRVLTDTGHTVKDLNGIAVSLGPGSFTGLRIGVTTAKSLAYTLGIPIVGIGTLDALAYSCGPSATDIICPMIHARTDEVYWSLFDSGGEMRLTDAAAGPVSAALKAAFERGETALFCGSGATKNAEAIRHTLGNKAIVQKSWTSFARGAAILELGHHLLQDGVAQDPASLIPLYIRKPTPVVRLETGEFEKT